MVVVARLTIEGLEILFGEPATRNFLVAFLIFATGHILVQLWRKRS